MDNSFLPFEAFYNDLEDDFTDRRRKLRKTTFDRLHPHPKHGDTKYRSRRKKAARRRHKDEIRNLISAIHKVLVRLPQDLFLNYGRQIAKARSNRSRLLDLLHEIKEMHHLFKPKITDVQAMFAATQAIHASTLAIPA